MITQLNSKGPPVHCCIRSCETPSTKYRIHNTKLLTYHIPWLKLKAWIFWNINIPLDIHTPPEKVFWTAKKTKGPSREVFGCPGMYIFVFEFSPWIFGKKGSPIFSGRGWRWSIRMRSLAGGFLPAFGGSKESWTGPKSPVSGWNKSTGFGVKFHPSETDLFLAIYNVFTFHLSRSFFVPTCTHCYIPWRIQSRLVWCNRKCWFLLGQWVGTCIIHGSYGYLDGANQGGMTIFHGEINSTWAGREKVEVDGLLSYWLGFKRLGVTCSVGKRYCLQTSISYTRWVSRCPCWDDFFHIPSGLQMMGFSKNHVHFLKVMFQGKEDIEL